MSTAFSAEVARYQAWPEESLDSVIVGMERMLAAQQSRLAAAKKARKNQKAAAKKRAKVDLAGEPAAN